MNKQMDHVIAVEWHQAFTAAFQRVVDVICSGAPTLHLGQPPRYPLPDDVQENLHDLIGALTEMAREIFEGKSTPDDVTAEEWRNLFDKHVQRSSSSAAAVVFIKRIATDIADRRSDDK